MFHPSIDRVKSVSRTHFSCYDSAQKFSPRIKPKKRSSAQLEALNKARESQLNQNLSLDPREGTERVKAPRQSSPVDSVGAEDVALIPQNISLDDMGYVEDEGEGYSGEDLNS